MIRKQQHNRRICTGDQFISNPHSSMKNEIAVAEKRMAAWTDKFIENILKTSNSKAWRIAAQNVLASRKTGQTEENNLWANRRPEIGDSLCKREIGDSRRGSSHSCCADTRDPDKDYTSATRFRYASLLGVVGRKAPLFGFNPSVVPAHRADRTEGSAAATTHDMHRPNIPPSETGQVPFLIPPQPDASGPRVSVP